MKNLINTVILQQRANSTTGKSLVEKMKADVAWFAKYFTDTPQQESGWGHHYFCNSDGTFLQYNRLSPQRHICPTCKKVFTDAAYNHAWLYLYRYDAFMSVYEAAALYVLEKDAVYLTHIQTILLFYAQRYAQFAPHGEASGLGKITPQMLDESVFLVRILCACMLVREDLSASFLQNVIDKLLLPAAYFVDEQKKAIHNIPCWINACVAGVGFFAHDEKLIHSALYGPFGLEQQLKKGVTADNFWFEGSIHYNFYTIEALLHTALFAKNSGITLPGKVTKTLYNMMLAPSKLAFEDTSLPNPNDGWPHVGLKTYAYLYEMAENFFEDGVLAGILEHIYAAPIIHVPLPLGGPLTVGAFSLEWLLLGTEKSPQTSNLFVASSNFPQSNYAMLRHDSIEVFIKYGHRSPSHAHPDKMNLEVQAYGTPVSIDLSNCGYAAYLCNAYYRRSHSHNTVVADEADHTTTHSGECVCWQAGETITTVSKNAYEGIDFTREIQMLPNGFFDTFAVNTKENHLYDWFFHVQGEVAFESYTTQPVETTYEGLWDCVRLVEDEHVVLHWKIGNLSAKQTISAASQEVIIGKGFDLPASRSRTTVMIRAQGKATAFKQKWEFLKV